MAMKIDGTGNVNSSQIGGVNPQPVEQTAKPVGTVTMTDNKFIKEVGEDLLTSTVASTLGLKITRPAGEKVDKGFWGDALNGLNLKDTAVSANTVNVVTNLDNTFAMITMEHEMTKSPFMQTLNNIFAV